MIKLKFLILIIVIFNYINGLTQNFINPDNTQKEGVMLSRENFGVFVVCFYTKISDSLNRIGSGSILKHNGRVFFLTAEHVYREFNENTSVLIQGNNGKLVQIQLNLIASKWQIHPIADIAICEIAISDTNILNSFRSRAIPLSCFESNKYKLPTMGNELLYSGYPMGIGIGEYISPLVFPTYRASGLLELSRADTKKNCIFFVTTTPLIQGTSGGPVLDLGSINNDFMKISGNHSTCYGVIHGTSSDATGGKMGLVTPGFYIFDLIK